MVFQKFKTPGIAQVAYLIGDKGEAVLVDPHLVASFQLSGALHPASDFVEIVTLGHQAPDDDHESDPDHDCPPGCPTCHHVHFSGASLPPAVGGAVFVLALTEYDFAELPYVDDAPRGPSLPSVYRPPRA